MGIAVGSGTDVAAETDDIILVNSNPKDIANLILFGKATYNKMIQNLVWATGYNVVAIPLAAGILYSSGFVLGPAAGAGINESKYDCRSYKCAIVEKENR